MSDTYKQGIKQEAEKIAGIFVKKGNAVIFVALVLAAVFFITCGSSASGHMDAYVAGT